MQQARTYRYARRALRPKLSPWFVVGLALLVGVLGPILSSPAVQAVTAADWRAGHIIDDAFFYNKDSMTVGQIQEFLNSKVPNCERWRSSSNSSNQPPFTCLKEYQENPTTKENNIGRFNGNGTPYNVPGGWSAAYIVWRAGQDYGINPQTLLVMLQKEQGLITDTWPWRNQYEIAMGYACPDTAPCNERYFGFYNQVDNAAWQLREYGRNPGAYLYRAGVTRYVGYNPDSGCGGTNVYIENQATAALYNYTPYQPNQGALNAGFGTAPCGAYGNRNFWLYFNNWFGTTTGGDKQVQVIEGLTVTPSTQAIANEPVRVRFVVLNNTGKPLYIGGLSVAVRRVADNANLDYPLRDVTLPAWSSYVYSEAQTLPAGSYNFEISNYRAAIGWSTSYPPSLHDGIARRVNNVAVQPPVYLSTGLSLSGSPYVVGKDVTAAFQIINPSATPVNLGVMAVVARGPQGQNYDFAPDANVVVPANGTYTYSKTRQLSLEGNYSLHIANYRPQIDWNATTPPSVNGSIVRSMTATVKPNPRITSGLTISPQNPVAGQTVTASFQLRNDSNNAVSVGVLAVTARDPQGRNVDFAPDANVTIPANTTYVYSRSQVFNSLGGYSFNIANYQPSTGWRTFPHYDTGAVSANALSVAPNPTVVSSLNVTPNDSVAGQNATASFSIRNSSDNPVTLGVIAVVARDPSGRNVDFAPDTNVTISPGATYTYSKTQPLMSSGRYSFSIANYQPDLGWNATYPVSASTSIVRSLTKQVDANPVVTTGLALSPTSPAAGQVSSVSFTITNSGSVAMPVGVLAVAVRGPQGQNYDFAPDANVIVPAGATYTYNKSQVLPISGTYRMWIANYQPGIGWNDSQPVSASGAITRHLSPVVKPNPRVTGSLSLSPASPKVGQAFTVSFQVRNDSNAAVNVGLLAVAARDPLGRNVDFMPDPDVTIPANSTYTYSKPGVFTLAGTYNLSVANYRNGVWSNAYPPADSASVLTTLRPTASP